MIHKISSFTKFEDSVPQTSHGPERAQGSRMGLPLNVGP